MPMKARSSILKAVGNTKANTQLKKKRRKKRKKKVNKVKQVY